MTAERFVSSECAVSVLGSFGFIVEGRPRRGLSHGSQRLLAFLALRDRAVTRTAVSGTLWPEASEEHAHASLRSALSRLEGIKRPLVRVTSHELSLADGVFVDIRDARLLAHRLLNPGSGPDSDIGDQAISTLPTDLLPDWYEDWAVVEAEEWRQLRLHALDALSERLTAAGRHADATSAGPGRREGGTICAKPLTLSSFESIWRKGTGHRHCQHTKTIAHRSVRNSAWNPLLSFRRWSKTCNKRNALVMLPFLEWLYAS